jgi:hypothetical protein
MHDPKTCWSPFPPMASPSAALFSLIALFFWPWASLPACTIDERCYQNADCPAPQVCNSKGFCVWQCIEDRECGPGFSCVDHVCRLAAGDGGVSDGGGACPSDMVLVANAFCIDRYEASRADATAQSPGTSEVATSRAGVLPWEVRDNATAQAACAAAGKRLCFPEEWRLACSGAGGRVYAYGNTYDPTACNGIDAFGRNAFHLTPTGSFPRCVSPEGAYDLNGNLWEHVNGGSDFTVRGGAFNCSDSATLHRCDYIPGSWAPLARGFRCCRGLP